MLTALCAYLARRRFNRLISKPFDERAEALRQKHVAGVTAVRQQQRDFLHACLAGGSRPFSSREPENADFGSVR